MANKQGVQVSGTSAPSAETVAMVTTLVIENNPAGQGVHISGTLNVLAGTTTTAIVVKCRQGNGVNGAQVGGTITHTQAAGVAASISFDFLDTSAFALVNQTAQWSITVAQTGGTANGTINQGVAITEPVVPTP